MFDNNDLYNISADSETTISIVTDDLGNNDCEVDSELLVDEIPILALRNTVIFPGTNLPITVARGKSINAIRSLNNKSGIIGLVCQKNADIEDPNQDDLYEIGVIGEVLRVIEIPNNPNLTVILQGKKRFKLNELTSSDPFLKAKYTVLDAPKPIVDDKEYDVLLESIREVSLHMMRMFGEPPTEIVKRINESAKSPLLVNYCCTNIPLLAAEKQELLSMDDEKEKAYRVLMILNRESQVLELKMNIQMKTREELNQQQKEYFLQQQMKTIQEELGGNPQQAEIEELRDKAKNKKWDKSVAEIVEKELKKLERLHPQSPDYSTQYTYIQTVLDLPWGEYTKDNFNLKNAKKVLDRDHFGLEQVKTRILEHLAVLKLKGDLKSPIICLYGPPGVGKTSLGKSVAEALNRKYARISLGGLYDESEIRGHRRTYIGAMPGRIIQSIQKAGSSNPVFILDEIDKIGRDFRGDPSSALLEVLDPEQNTTFHDNYLNIDYDLSKVLFIATANNISNISQPLLDRMEMIEVSGYLVDEKIKIAKKHLIPKQLENHGLKKGDIDIPTKTLEKIIENYTHEWGVRSLTKRIAEIMRKVALKVATKTEYNTTLNPEELDTYLTTSKKAKVGYR